MEIKIQKCQVCKSRDLRNILVRDEIQKVYVQCRACGELVARYMLSKGGYFHAGRGFESFLRSHEREGDMDSARTLSTAFEDMEENIEKEFTNLKGMMKDIFGDTLP
ncbi:hypothetical protein SAMN02745866_01974 [Alteromonadaceae bacterium Bs31]|nr:hypothetical protein SAMN02745866_01974 [Alteromonadaceae bacterium Bs31]